MAERARSDDLVVRVVDPDGHAVVDLPVHLRPPRPTEGQRERRGRTQPTDALGRARFAGMRATLRDEEPPWILSHEVCFETPPRLELDQDRLALEEVISVQPWFGSLIVHVWEPDGTVPMDGLEVELALRRAEERVDGELALDRPNWGRRLVRSKARYPFVERGRDWVASAWHLDPDARTSVEGPGPGTRGQEARFDVRLGSDRPVFVFRAVDESGHAFAGVELTLEDSGFLSKRAEVRADEGGFFRIDGLPGGRSARLALGGGSHLVRLQHPEGERLGRAVTPRTGEPGQVNGGDVVLAARPLLAAGHVVDETGAGVAGAHVAAGANTLDSGVFREGPGFETTCADDGSFELHGMLPDAEFPIRAAGPGSRSDDVTVREGRRDVRLVLRGRHTVTGRVLTAAGLNPGALSIVLRRATEPGQTRIARWCSWSPSPVACA